MNLLDPDEKYLVDKPTSLSAGLRHLQDRQAGHVE
jgi:hypothetical protein